MVCMMQSFLPLLVSYISLATMENAYQRFVNNNKKNHYMVSAGFYRVVCIMLSVPGIGSEALSTEDKLSWCIWYIVF